MTPVSPLLLAQVGLGGGTGLSPAIVVLGCLLLLAAPVALALGVVAWWSPRREGLAWPAALLGAGLVAVGLWPLGLPGLGLGLAALLPRLAGRSRAGQALLEGVGLALVSFVPAALLTRSSPVAAAALRHGQLGSAAPAELRLFLTCYAVMAGVCMLLRREAPEHRATELLRESAGPDLVLDAARRGADCASGACAGAGSSRDEVDGGGGR